MTPTRLWLALAGCCALFGQSMTEHAVLTGSATKGAAAARKVGKANREVLSGVAAALGRTANGAASTTSVKTQVKAATYRSSPSVDLRSDLQPEDVREGMTYEELAEIGGGSPSLKITLPDAHSEQFVYQLKSGGTLDITLENGKVTRVERGR